jgi:hypothetical protein
LIGHLKHNFPAQYRLYQYLQDKKSPPTDEEVEIAQGRRAIDPEKLHAYVAQVERETDTLLKMFAKQRMKVQVSRQITLSQY